MSKARRIEKSGTLAVLAISLLAGCSSASDAETTTRTDDPSTPADARTESSLKPEWWTHRRWQDRPSWTPTTTPTTPPTSTPTAPPPSSAPTTTPPATPPTPPPATTPPAVRVPYRGINLAGGEFGTAIPGKFGTDYTFPTSAEVDYYMSKGMNTFRVGFRWERLQAAAYGELDATYFGRIDAVVAYATSKGAHVVLNPHNFARYYGSTVGSSQVPNAVFADFWKRLSSKYASNSRVMFNLVNEPHDMPTEQWVGAANAAIAAIRGAGANNVIIVPGNAWTGAHSWYSTGYGTSNAVAMLNIKDSANNVLFEAHQYMDSDSSGGSDQCMSTTIGSERLAPFVKWLRDNHKRGFVGEFAGGRNQTCYAAAKDMVGYMMAQSDVLDGWLWWAGGPWWGDYVFTLEPTGGQDRPQMGILLPFLQGT